MILTGKCKKYFDRWFDMHYKYKRFDLCNDNFKCMYIIEFFDSIEIYILINRECYFYYEIESEYFTFRKRGFGYNSRLAANKSAIIKVNEIYNNKNLIKQ